MVLARQSGGVSALLGLRRVARGHRPQGASGDQGWDDAGCFGHRGEGGELGMVGAWTRDGSGGVPATLGGTGRIRLACHPFRDLWSLGAGRAGGGGGPGHGGCCPPAYIGAPRVPRPKPPGRRGGCAVRIVEDRPEAKPPHRSIVPSHRLRSRRDAGGAAVRNLSRTKSRTGRAALHDTAPHPRGFRSGHPHQGHRTGTIRWQPARASTAALCHREFVARSRPRPICHGERCGGGPGLTARGVPCTVGRP